MCTDTTLPLHETSSGRRYVPPPPLILLLSLRGHISWPREQFWGSEIRDSVTHESSMSDSTKCLHKINVFYHHYCVLNTCSMAQEESEQLTVIKNQTQLPDLSCQCSLVPKLLPDFISQPWVEGLISLLRH